MNEQEEDVRCHPSPSGSSERLAVVWGERAAPGDAAVASDAAPGPHRRPPRTDV